MYYLGNAFSLQMLAGDATVKVTAVTLADVSALLNSNEFQSVIGHADTANIVSGLVGKEIAYNRVSIQLNPGDVLLVAQVTGGRLPEGTTELPEGFQLSFRKVTLV